MNLENSNFELTEKRYAYRTEKALFSIQGKINRKDWRLNWNAALETGGVLVSDEVWINCEVQLIEQPA